MCAKHSKFENIESNLRPIAMEEFVGTFCKFNEENFKALTDIFQTDTFKSRFGELKYLYVTNENKVSCSYLSKKELKKLGLVQIKFIDGFWYYKSDLK